MEIKRDKSFLERLKILKQVQMQVKALTMEKCHQELQVCQLASELVRENFEN